MNSLWISDESQNYFSKYTIELQENNKGNKEDKDTFEETCDICIIGAGIFGLTCGYYLSKLGFKVVVLEKHKIGHKTTGHTTGKITSLHGLFYDYLISNYGKKYAKDYLEANEEAISNIKKIIDDENIKCDFEFQNNYVYTTKKDDLKKIKDEVKAVQDLGYNCEFVTKTGLPFEVEGAICFKNQAQFHPLKYLEGLCKCITNYKGKIFTNTTAFDVKNYGVLENEAKSFFPNCEILYRWNTRDCISLDKIPYIGTYSALLPNVFVGTGFKKWGMTSSNVAANIIVDSICGKQNQYAYVFDSSRVKPLKNADEMKNIIVQSTNSLLLNKLRPANMNFDNIANDSGSIIEVNGEKVGVYKDPSGKIFAVRPICTHLGCLLSWNDIDKTWDCPCHGSRFDFMGKNIYDPAFKDLELLISPK